MCAAVCVCDTMTGRLSGVALLVIISVSLSLSVISHIIAISTQHWIDSTSSDTAIDRPAGTFLNLGLWSACFNNYQHRHERTARRYDGCHSLYSEYYANIRNWLIPRLYNFTSTLYTVGQKCTILFVAITVKTVYSECFNDYQNRHEHAARRYDGCHYLYSQ